MTQIIPDNIKNEQVLTKEIDAFFHRYINSSLLKKCGFYKKGDYFMSNSTFPPKNCYPIIV